MSDIDELYQRIILEHARRPRNERSFAGVRVERVNALCGDEVAVTVRMEGGVIADVGAVAGGGALSKAAASMMTEAVAGKTVAEARDVARRFRGLVDGGAAEGLGEMAAFAGVARFPSRQQCATMAWEALMEALPGEAATPG